MTLVAGSVTFSVDLSAGYLSTVLSGNRAPVWIVGSPTGPIALVINITSAGVPGVARFTWSVRESIVESDVLTSVGNIYDQTFFQPPGTKKTGWGASKLGNTGLVAKFAPITYVVGDSFGYALPRLVGAPIADGTGLAFEIGTREAARMFARMSSFPLPLPDPDDPGTAQTRSLLAGSLLASYNEVGAQATSYAAGIIEYLTRNAVTAGGVLR